MILIRVISKYIDMITWRKISVSDYNNILVKWWKDNGWTTPPTLDYLPEGYMVSNDGKDAYAGFIYYTGTKIAWFEFIVSNYHLEPTLKRGCLEKLIDVVSIIAKDKGVDVLFTSTNNMGYCNSLKKNGFVVGDKEIIQLTKKL